MVCWRQLTAVVAAFVLGFMPESALAASFTFSLSVPIQCQNMTVYVQGGVPPYQLLVIPSGNVEPETRTIFQTPNFTTPSYSFKLDYPARSNFVAVMSDATGRGSGGTTVATTVAASPDDSCLSPTVSPKFFFFINYVSLQGARNTITQCAPSTFSANASAQGTVTMYGVIPGGDTFFFDFPAGQSYLFNASIKAGTSVTFVAGDDTGIGAGGSVGPLEVQAGSTSCLDATSPSSTAGSPAGGLQTSSSSAQSGSSTANPSSSSPATSSGAASGSSSGGSHAGAIAGGVVGGVVGLALVAGLLYFLLVVRKRSKSTPGAQPNVDLAGEESGAGRPTNGESGVGMSQHRGDGFYTPAPFIVPEASSNAASSDLNDPTSPSSTHGGSSSAHGLALASRARRVSQNSLSSSDFLASSAGGRTGVSGKKQPPSSLRAVNMLQGDDGGDELVELPPTYDTLKGKGGKAERVASSNNVMGGKAPGPSQSGS